MTRIPLLWEHEPKRKHGLMHSDASRVELG